MVSVFRHGINNDNIGPIAKASFEETPKMFLDAAQHAMLDTMRGVSANVMCGQEGYFGTSAFKVILDLNAMKSAPVEAIPTTTVNDTIDIGLQGALDPNDPCSASKLDIQNNAVHIQGTDMGGDDDYNPGF